VDTIYAGHITSRQLKRIWNLKKKIICRSGYAFIVIQGRAPPHNGFLGPPPMWPASVPADMISSLKLNLTLPQSVQGTVLGGRHGNGVKSFIALERFKGFDLTI
jgi:hypothetical protein